MSNNFSLSKINVFTYNLKINGENYKTIYKSILKIIKSSHFDYTSNSLLIKCEKITTLKKYILSLNNKKLSYGQCIQLIDDLSKQIKYLHAIDYGFYGFDLNDILTVDDHFFVCNPKYLVSLTDDLIFFDYPIEQPYFSSPEIIKLTTLPSEINYRCSYYSLGALIIFCLLNNYLLVGNEIKTAEEIDKIFAGLKWITPFDYYERSKQEVLLLNEIKNFILFNKEKDRPIIITDYLFFSAISNLEIPSPIKWYDSVIIPEKNNKYYNYYRVFFVNKILNNNVKNIYLIGNMSTHIFLDLIENKKCVIFKKINDLMSVYNIEQCKFIL